jgi:hypothetical protein
LKGKGVGKYGGMEGWVEREEIRKVVKLAQSHSVFSLEKNQ